MLEWVCALLASPCPYPRRHPTRLSPATETARPWPCSSSHGVAVPEQTQHHLPPPACQGNPSILPCLAAPADALLLVCFTGTRSPPELGTSRLWRCHGAPGPPPKYKPSKSSNNEDNKSRSSSSASSPQAINHGKGLSPKGAPHRSPQSLLPHSALLLLPRH